MILSTYDLFRATFATTTDRDVAGWEEWPTTNVVYASEVGFHLALPTALNTTQIISVNALANDAVAHVDEFDFYLSQRTDDPAAQLLSIQRSDIAPNTRSGTILMLPKNPLMLSLYGSLFPLPPEQGIAIFRDTWLYVRRRSNGHIMRASFLAAANVP
jgi:hypothetical protein